MKLKRGVNLGGFLSQCNHEISHYESFIGKDDIARIAQMGFDHVRLPIDYNVLETDEGEKKENGYVYVDNMVKAAADNGLDIILDLHKAYGYDFNFAGTEENSLFKNDNLQQRFVDLWIGIAKRYGKEKNVAFELLNEIVEEDVIEAWNDLSDRTVGEIRKYAATTPVIYGGVLWNSATTLKYVRKPKYNDVIFTFHFYEPLIFTHQKAHWVKNMDMNRDVYYPESMDYYREVSKPIGAQGGTVLYAKSATMGPEFMKELFEEAIAAAKEKDVPLYVGEFGVIDQAPLEDTVRWFRDVDDVFREYNIGCAIWTYKGMNFDLIGEHYAPILDELLEIWKR